MSRMDGLGTYKVCLVLVDLYAVALLLYLGLRLLFADRLWPVALVSVFLHWLLLPSLVLFPAQLLLRRWPAAVLQGVSVLAFLWLFGALFLPQPSPAADSRQLTVMTYNVFNSRATPAELQAAIRSSGADLVALTELSSGQAESLRTGLQDRYPFQVLYGYGMPGLGLLSRYPIREQERFYLQSQRLPHLRATVVLSDTAGQPLTVTVIVAHPPPPTLDRFGYHIHPDAAAEIATLSELATAGQPALVVGDFNLVDQSDNYRLLLRAGLNDAFRAAGWGFGATYPVHQFSTPIPLVRIDYIWYTAPFQAARAWVGPDAGSNHLPVLAELKWR